MTQSYKPDATKKKIVFGIMLAVIMAFLSQYLIVFSLFISVITVFIVYLYAYGGIIPVAAASVFSLVAFEVYFGFIGALTGAVAFILPAAFIIRFTKLRYPFFTQLKLAIVAQILGVLAAMTVIYFYAGTDISSALSDSVRQMLTSAPASAVDVLLATAYNNKDIVAKLLSSEEIVTEIYTQAQRADMIEAFATYVKSTLSLLLPGLLISSSVLTAIVSVTWSNSYIEKHSGGGVFRPIKLWYTPYGLSIGMLVMYGAAYLFTSTDIAGVNTVFTTIQTLVILMFKMQAAISFERRLSAMNLSKIIRGFGIISIMVIGGTLFAYIGCFSALFGSTGAVRQLMIKYSDKNEQ